MALCMVQQLQGTTPLFSVCTGGFIILSVLAFNVAGGLTRPSGTFVLSYALLAVVFGVVYKVVVGEPGQSNLFQPDRTMELYVASSGSFLVAAYLGQRFRSKKYYLPQFSSNAALYRSSVGLLIAGAALVLLLTFVPSFGRSGGILTGISHLTAFIPLSTLMGVTYQIRKSNGRSSINGPVVLGILLTFFFGVVNYSKEGMMSPFIFWLLPAAAHRYKVSLVQIGAISVAFTFIVYYLVPYSQYGRNFKDPDASYSENLKTNLVLLSNLELVRKVYTQSAAEQFADDSLFHYYNKPQGFADRVQMITPDDAIIDATEHGAVFGIFPTIFSFENLIPHIIWPSKPSISWGNTYAHELGIISDEEDVSTGISFSPTGEAYHQAKWVGVFVLLPLLAFMLFVVMDSVCGDTRLSPFALLPGLGYLHGAPEGGITQFAGAAVFGAVSIIIAAFIGAYIMPLIASLLLGPPKDEVSGELSWALQGRIGEREPIGVPVE